MKTIIMLLVLIITTLQVNAQLSAPEPEAVYGGRIIAMDAYPISATTTRLFISTESANSIFYADMITSGSGSVFFSPFTVMPGAGDDDGYGNRINNIAVHKDSGYLFFLTQNGDLVRSKPSRSTVDIIYANHNKGLHIFNYSDSLSYIYFVADDSLNFGTLDIAGNFTKDTASPINISSRFFSDARIFIGPSNNKLYIAEMKDTLIVYKSNDDYDSLRTSSMFSMVNTSALTTSGLQWNAFGFGPDGTLFIGGDNGLSKTVAYTTDDGATWNIDATGISGVSGPNFAFPGTGSSYPVYFSTCYSSFSSSSGFGSWSEFGSSGFETHPNDGAVFGDPLNSQVVYLTTDQGIGATTNGGPNIFEIDDGVLAVQVQDFDMDAGKTTGWVASKSGIRKVSNFSVSPEWSLSMFPNGDGSPYYSAEMIGNDTNSVLVGNLRIYKTNNAGANWTQVFTAENPPYNFDGIWSSIRAIEVCSWDTNLVMAGYDIQGTDQGGLFYSTDGGGGSWDQLLLKATSTGHDADVWDIVFTQEDSNTVAYIGVFYDLDIPTISDRARSIYRAEWDGTSWSVRQDMDGAYTSVGYPITASILDLEVSSTGDTIFAVGSDAGINHPIAYYKDISGTNLWTPFTTSGFPISGLEGKAITLGTDTVYAAVDNEIYFYNLSGSFWSLAYSYPVGTEINVLYFDDLLVGTGTGLYNQHGLETVSVDEKNTIAEKYELHQNYPNPFNPGTVIEYSIPAVETGYIPSVQLKIYDILGREVATLVNEMQNPGKYKINFDAKNLSSGIYFYKLSVKSKDNNFVQIKKMILLR